MMTTHEGVNHGEAVGRLKADDALFTDGNAFCRLFVREGIVDIDDELLCHQVVGEFACEVPGCRQVLSSLLESEIHYQQRHRFVCCQCRKPLPSAHFLDIHLTETHDSFFAVQAQRKPMFRCFVEECSVVSENEAQRMSHCIETHNFPHDFRYDQSHKKPKKQKPVLNPVAETSKPAPTLKNFSFGSSKKKSFARPWHAQGKPASAQPPNPDSLSTVELMDTLPTL